MKKIVLGFAAVLLSLAFVATEAEAARLGGGVRSMGAQRSFSAPPARPVQAQPAPQSPSAAAPAAPQPAAASGMSRWMPLLGGLALGGALGWLLGANGMGGALVGMMLFALLAFAGIFIFRMLTQRRDATP